MTNNAWHGLLIYIPEFRALCLIGLLICHPGSGAKTLMSGNFRHGSSSFRWLEGTHGKKVFLRRGEFEGMYATDVSRLTDGVEGCTGLYI